VAALIRFTGCLAVALDFCCVPCHHAAGALVRRLPTWSVLHHRWIFSVSFGQAQVYALGLLPGLVSCPRARDFVSHIEISLLVWIGP
jgi:hypothetical protein